MDKRKTKVAIIGAGSAGLSAASEIKKVSEDFLIINDGPYGTTCARVGCMPSKVLIHAANDFHRRAVYEQIGINGGDSLSIDIPQVMRHVRGLRDRFVRGVMKGLSADPKHNLTGRARFLEPNVLKVGDDIQVEAEKVIIATGSTPIVPAPWRALGDRLVTTDQFFELETLPSRVAVAGLGVIGVELGQAMARLGIEVVGVGSNTTIAGISDPVIGAYAEKILGQDMELWLGEPAAFEASSDGVLVKAGQREKTVDLVLASIGRRPNVSDLGLEDCGVAVNEHGIPLFNNLTMQVGDYPIFIAGDVTSEKAILHEAADEGRIAGYNAIFDEKQSFKRRAWLGICFSDPNICTAGARYDEIKHLDPVIGEVSFEGQGRSLSMVKNKGHLRLYVSKDSAKVLGAEMMAPQGEHLAHLLSWEIQNGATVFELLQKPYYHPVVEEGLRTAVRDCARQLGEGHSPFELVGCWDNCIDPLF